jgi:Domain of Unknown Function (DUF1080)
MGSEVTNGRKTMSWKYLCYPILALQAAAFGQAVNTLTAEEKAQGFALLFDGTMQSVRDNFVAYQQNGANVTTLPANIEVPAGKDYFWDNNATQDIRTKTMYDDFELKFDYRISDNAGLYYRAALLTSMIYDNAVEYPIYNGTPVAGNWNAPGAAYDIYPPGLINYKKFETGEWNSIRVRLIKDSVYHWHNDALVLKYSMASSDFKKSLDAHKWANIPCLSVEAATLAQCDHSNPYRATGYIGLQTGYPGQLYVRNMKIAKYPFPTVSALAKPVRAGIAWRPLPGFRINAGEGKPARYELRRTDGSFVASSASGELQAPGPGIYLLARVGAAEPATRIALAQ